MPHTALDCAAQLVQIAIVGELLAHGPPSEQRPWGNHTPLHRATPTRRQDKVEVLVAAGSDLNTGTGYHTLLIAAIHSNREPTAIAPTDQMSAQALDEAMERRRLRVTQLMFARGIASAVSPPLHLAVTAGQEYVKLCLDHGADITGV